MIAIMKQKFTNIFCTSILDKKIFLITAMKSLGWWWWVYFGYIMSALSFEIGPGPRA